MTERRYVSSRSGSSTPTVLVLLLLLAAAGVGYFMFFSGKDVTETTAVAPPEVPAVEEEPPEPAPPPPTQVIQEIETDDALDEWLSVPGIVQRLAAATWRVSNGESPAPVLGFLNLEGRFAVREDGETMYIDPAGYDRYNPIIDRITAVDPSLAAKAYRRLRPNFEEAFKEIAEPGERFHNVAKKAVDRVLNVEVPTGDIEVVGKGATFFYADDTLEAMSDADKHVMRLGPKNAKRVKDWLRKFAKEASLL